MKKSHLTNNSLSEIYTIILSEDGARARDKFQRVLYSRDKDYDFLLYTYTYIYAHTRAHIFGYRITNNANLAENKFGYWTHMYERTFAFSQVLNEQKNCYSTSSNLPNIISTDHKDQILFLYLEEKQKVRFYFSE